MATPWQERQIADPVVYPCDAAFWEAASQGRLLLKRCGACGDAHWYPRPICPFCGSDDTHWEPASGKGTVYAVTVTRKAGPVPYALAYVTLEEGVTVTTNIVDCDLDTVRIDDPVQVVFKNSKGGQAVPMFRPA
jgi:uncharacterized OB-fold protein